MNHLLALVGQAFSLPELVNSWRSKLKEAVNNSSAGESACAPALVGQAFSLPELANSWRSKLKEAANNSCAGESACATKPFAGINWPNCGEVK